MARQRRQFSAGSHLLETIQALVHLIAETEFAEPLTDDVMLDRRIYRACLDWRLAALVEQSVNCGQSDEPCH